MEQMTCQIHIRWEASLWHGGGIQWAKGLECAWLTLSCCRAKLAG